RGREDTLHQLPRRRRINLLSSELDADALLCQEGLEGVVVAHAPARDPVQFPEHHEIDLALASDDGIEGARKIPPLLVVRRLRNDDLVEQAVPLPTNVLVIAPPLVFD